MTTFRQMRRDRMVLSEKIQGRHQDRLAIVYVRQSTLRQVEQHQESTRLQYALVERALQLGWARERIEVIDDDLGRSGASAVDRPGFQRLVAEVGLGRVGLVLGVEMSRLARSCRDWHQLLEICALFDTLIGDADGIYCVNDFNDRLLLGLKGTMSEAELHILKARMLQGRRAKAQRGELRFQLPRGYVLNRTGEIVLDDDEQVQATIRLVFDLFERRRTLQGVLQSLVAQEIRLPCRVISGWRRASWVASAKPRHAVGDAAQPAVRRGLLLWTAAAATTLPRRPGDRRGAGADQRMAACIHQLGDLRTELGADGSKPRTVAGSCPRRVGAARRPGRLRAMWPTHGDAVSEQWQQEALRLHPARKRLRWPTLPVARRNDAGRAAGRADAASADARRSRGQPAAGGDEAVLHGSGDGRTDPYPVRGHAMRTDSGRPSSSMRFRAWTATSTSVARRWSVRERSPSPITCLNLPMVASARARVL